MKIKHAVILVSVVLLTAVSCKGPVEKVSEWPYVLFAGDYPDPSIFVDGKDYYMTFTANYWLPALPIWHSTDMVNWEHIGNALEKYIGTVWAADIQKIDGRYVIYFPAGHEIYAVYADAMAGPWSDPVSLGIHAIDPGYVENESGARCLYVNGGRMTALSSDGLSTVGELRQVYDAWPIPDTWEVECECLESPKLMKHDGWYYIVSAEGGTAGPATSHMAAVHRSRQIEGPWEASPYNPVVHTWSADEEWWSKGHGTLFADVDGQWWMVYHAYRKGYHTLGRHTLLEPMTWTEDGWPVADSTAVRKLPKRRTTPALQWQSWRGNEGLRAAVTGDTCYTFTAHVDISGTTEKAGVMLSYNNNHFTGLTIDKHELCVWHDGQRAAMRHNEVGESLYVRIVNDRQQVTLAVGSDVKHLQPVGGVYDVSEMHHNNICGFMSLRPAQRQPSGCVIDDIKYEPIAH